MTDQPARERFEKALHLALALRDDSRGDAARVEVLRLYDEQTAAMHDMQERHREAVEHLTRQRDERHANPTPDEKASELHRALNELVQPAAPVCGELFVPDGWRNSLLRIRDEMVAERNWQTKYPWTHGTVPARLSGEREAFEQSVKLQSHYAELLNQYDGGERLTFASADAWIARLAAAGSGSLFDDYQTLNNVLDDPAAIWRVVSASGKNVYFTDTDPRPGNMESGGTATKYERAAGSDGKAEPVVTIGECAQLVWSGEVHSGAVKLPPGTKLYAHPPAEAWAEVRAVAGELEDWAKDTSYWPSSNALRALAARLRAVPDAEPVCVLRVEHDGSIEPYWLDPSEKLPVGEHRLYALKGGGGNG